MTASRPNESSIRLLGEYVSLHEGVAPSQEEVNRFVTAKCREKCIFENYEMQLITQDEVCSLLLAHTHSHFISSDQTTRDDQVQRYHDELKGSLFGSA